jgi:carbon monoxide dehydrogenase subunit G
MKITGARIFDATAQKIWDILMDPEALAQITPGITRLEQTGPDAFRAIADVKIGPVSGSFTGKVDLLEKDVPRRFVMHVEQNSKIGNVAADVLILLEGLPDGKTELRFDGNAQLSGLLARTGQRVLTGVANTLTEQFFKGLTEALRA